MDFKEFRGKIVERFRSVLNSNSKSKNLEIAIYNWAINRSNNTNDEIININPKSKEISDTSPTASYVYGICKNDNFREVYLNYLYKQKVRNVLLNLQDKKDDSYKNVIINSKTDFLKRLPYLQPWDICPEKWQHILKANEKREICSILCDNHTETGLFQCCKCKSYNTVHYQIQTRSADEPMTVYITCKDCNTVSKE